MNAQLPHRSALGAASYGPDDPRVAREVMDSLFLVTTERDVPDWIALSGSMTGEQEDAIVALTQAVTQGVKRAFPGYFGSLAFFLDPRHVIVAIEPFDSLGPTAASFAERGASVLGALPGVVGASKLSPEEYFAYVLEGRRFGDVPSGGSGGDQTGGGDGSGGTSGGSRSSSASIPPWAWILAGGALLFLATRKRVS